jgi:raffinose/stachyose/melibiose transport system substrate-binding protein
MKKLIRFLVPALIISLLIAQGLVVRAADPVKIVMWSIADETDALHTPMVNAVERYNKAHAGQVEVDITYIHNDQFKPQLEIAIAGEKPPDVFQSWGGGQLQVYVNAGVVREVAALSGDAGKKFNAGAFGPGTVNGKRYAVPVDLAGVFLWVNVDILNENKLPMPDTWENLIADCKGLSAKSIIPIALNNKDKWPGAFYTYYLVDRIGGSQAFLNAFNGVDGATFADPVFVQAGTMIQEAVDAGCFEPGYNGIPYDQTLMGSGQAAMQLQGNWNLDGLRKAGLEDKSMKAMPFPAVKDGKGDPTDMIGGTGQSYIVSAKAPKEADDAIIEMLSSEDFGKDVAGVGNIPAVAGGDQFLKDAIVQSMAGTLGKSAFVQLYWDQFLSPALAQVFLQGNQETFGKTTTPEKAAADMAAAAKAPAPTEAAK